jgi:hypothetical protein
MQNGVADSLFSTMQRLSSYLIDSKEKATKSYLISLLFITSENKRAYSFGFDCLTAALTVTSRFAILGRHELVIKSGGTF